MKKVLDHFASGKMVILCDHAEREDEGDLCVASELISAEHISFMLNHARGLICVSLSDLRARELGLGFQVRENNSVFQTPFAPSVDLKKHRGLGMEAEARAETVRRLVAPDAIPEEFTSPGHVFPLIANPAGVFGRAGQTEGSFDLARLAGLSASGVICEVLNDDGTVAKGEALRAFSEKYELPIVSVQEIAQYRSTETVLVRKVASAREESPWGPVDVSVFHDDLEEKEHLALQFGTESAGPPLVRLHSECLTGDVFGSRRCDCGLQLRAALEQISREGRGVLLYLRQEGRGIGLLNKLRAYELQDRGSDTVEANIHLGFEADQRDYRVAVNILTSLGISAIRLMTNNPRKIEAFERSAIEVVERVPLVVPSDKFSEQYVKTKRDKLGHLF